MNHAQQTIDRAALRATLQHGIKAIAPLWSLENFVAVNPYLGLADLPFHQAMDFLHKSARVSPTLPVSFYLEALDKGSLTRDDIREAQADSEWDLDEDVEMLLAALQTEGDTSGSGHMYSLVDVASRQNGKTWTRFLIDRVSFWASAYFDENQAIWDTASQDQSLFAAWKREAEVDYSPTAMGLKGFRKLLRSLPDDHLAAAAQALARLDLPQDALPLYLAGLLMKLNGWAGVAARIDWEANLAGQDSQAVEEFLAILLVWEMAILELLPYPQLEQAWREAKWEAAAAAGQLDRQLARGLILQEAFDKANQRSIIGRINAQPAATPRANTPDVQAVFCIDVRSEVYRRHLESVSSGIETMGFAGFFAFPIEYVPLAHSTGTQQCPVLLTTTHTVQEGLHDPAEEQRAIAKRSLREQVAHAWKSFKLGAVTCFSFVGPVGLAYLPKLFTDSFGLSRPLPQPEVNGLSPQQQAQKGVRLDQGDVAGKVAGIPLADRLAMAQSALKAMSITEGFARTVLIVGHGSTTVNNPHATGLDCGACGGHTGEANAKVAAAVLNDPEVRVGLRAAGIHLPDSTLFVAALHDTTTDEVTLYKAQSEWPDSHQADLVSLQQALQLAGRLARQERAARMNILHGDLNAQVLQRSRDWSQVRPEWGLAGCSSFIVAPRERTAGLNLGGKAFMHSYVWQQDSDFSVLELIMTAPMVVTSWINLQYYASTVDNNTFGAGNKTLHNVVAGHGVLEGFAGDLRTGLPWQSIHDGQQYQHEPQRLNVIIEAPVDEMSRILDKHESVRHLCDNGWIFLFAMNDEGKVAYRYIGDLQWEVV